MTRAALVFACLATGACPAFADPAFPDAPADIGASPWMAVATSQAFGPEDAYLFAEPAAAPQLDQEAEDAALLVDRERMAQRPATSLPRGQGGRVALAFADFVAYGSDGRATASVALVSAGGGARVAMALGPTAFALAGR